MRVAAGAVCAALLSGAQAWPASCHDECRPTTVTTAYGTKSVLYPVGTRVGPRYTCPQASFAEMTAAYVVSVASKNSSHCPGRCRPVTSAQECSNAAAWLQLGMDGQPGPCPTAEQLVGSQGMWAAEVVHSFSGGSLWQTRLGGCSWRPRDTRKKLTFNVGDLTCSSDEHCAHRSIPVVATPADDWLVCRCPTMADLPDYLAVVAGARCPDADRELAGGAAQPTCGPLTTEAACEAAAGSLGLPDQSLDMCVGGCDGGSPVQSKAINTPAVGRHRPAGCHYRYHPDVHDDQLWFNPHGAADSPVYATPPGTGRAPDYMVCGCNSAAPAAGPSGCQPVGSRSRACGHGQTCESTVDGFQCICDLPAGAPAHARNEPAQCTEQVPIKYISWVQGTECPFDEDTQCLPPPTKQRCEEAAAQLGLTDGDGRASEHTEAERQAPWGCHYVAGDASALRWNPAPAGGGFPASAADSLICECRQYPSYVPKLAGVGCGTGPGACKRVSTRHECAIAADSLGVPVPAEMQPLDLWHSTLCAADLEAGPGSRWVPCSSPGAPNCTDPSVETRYCRFSNTLQIYVPVDPPAAGSPALDGCQYHAGAGHGGSPLWWHSTSTGDASLLNTPHDFRVCSCAAGAVHAVIAHRHGFSFVGDGDCSQGTAPGGTCAGQAGCVVRASDGHALLRSHRYNCTALPTEAECNADVHVCGWDGGGCVWRNESFAYKSEIPAHFSDCLEHCLLLSHCSGVSFFMAANRTQADLGGCDFFTGGIVEATGESVREGKGAGAWQCWRNVHEVAEATPAPTYDCPRCNAIPGQKECGNTFGCAWSSADYCCCDPFVSACTTSWHTTTDTRAACEATTDEGRSCKWIPSPHDPNAGICELPVEDCVDVYADVAVLGPDSPTLCRQMVLSLREVFPQIRAGCGDWCNVTFPGAVTMLQMGLDLGNKSCGQATRMAHRLSQRLSQLVGTPLAGRPLVKADVRSKCWDDCAANPRCPKNPTAAPTPIWPGTKPATVPPAVDITLPPVSYRTGFSNATSPTEAPVAPRGPTAAPEFCPVRFTTSSPQAFDCECEKFVCSDGVPVTKPFSGSAYEYCGVCDKRLDGALHFTCPHCAAQGTQINITCPAHWEACDMFVYTYRQLGCSEGSNGAWPENLAPGDGWQASSCAPKFCGGNTCQGGRMMHSTVSFHKQILGDETEEFPETLTEPSMYTTFVVKQGKVCGNALSRDDCEDGVGVCAWLNGECSPYLCRRPPPEVTPPDAPRPPLPPRGTYPTPRFPGAPAISYPAETPCCMLGSRDGDCSAGTA
eukprot:TRINITY_DN204_c0_g2_i9.p1 TRINITY_DN204_c0_g2~~TRINITY_DN204_c0_g2_i9.p1  ORF type:complete len:1298 (+),score=350.56 TRINITY_DN204_c0_g2_i9:79-3972(+)